MTTPTLDTVRSELAAAKENGYVFEDWSVFDIADDMMAYSQPCEDADRDELAALILKVRQEEQDECSAKSAS